MLYSLTNFNISPVFYFSYYYNFLSNSLSLQFYSLPPVLYTRLPFHLTSFNFLHLYFSRLGNVSLKWHFHSFISHTVRNPSLTSHPSLDLPQKNFQAAQSFKFDLFCFYSVSSSFYCEYIRYFSFFLSLFIYLSIYLSLL